jgi:hypothetical protein
LSLKNALLMLLGQHAYNVSRLNLSTDDKSKSKTIIHTV